MTDDHAVDIAPARSQGFGRDLPDAHPERIAPGSALYTMLCDATVGLYSVPLFLLPLLHPATAASTDRYDGAFQGDPTDARRFALRLADTMETISGVVYAVDESEHVGFSIRELHRNLGGELPSGQRYHPWEPEVWTWNWAAISAAILDVFGGLRGFPDDDFRDEAYLGLVELGRRFEVRGMPDSYDEFAAMWPALRDEIADPTTPAMQRVIGTLSRGNLAPSGAFARLPGWMWEAVTLPLRHTQRVAVRVAMPEHFHEAAGLGQGRWGKPAVRMHVGAWRLVPRRASHEIGLRTLQAHHRHGRPAWRGRFSAERLADARRRGRKSRGAPSGDEVSTDGD